jgi:hypothetical protein
MGLRPANSRNKSAYGQGPARCSSVEFLNKSRQRGSALPSPSGNKTTGCSAHSGPAVAAAAGTSCDSKGAMASGRILLRCVCVRPLCARGKGGLRFAAAVARATCIYKVLAAMYCHVPCVPCARAGGGGGREGGGKRGEGGGGRRGLQLLLGTHLQAAI